MPCFILAFEFWIWKFPCDKISIFCVSLQQLCRSPPIRFPEGTSPRLGQWLLPCDRLVCQQPNLLMSGLLNAKCQSWHEQAIGSRKPWTISGTKTMDRHLRARSRYCGISARLTALRGTNFHPYDGNWNRPPPQKFHEWQRIPFHWPGVAFHQPFSGYSCDRGPAYSLWIPRRGVTGKDQIPDP